MYHVSALLEVHHHIELNFSATLNLIDRPFFPCLAMNSLDVFAIFAMPERVGVEARVRAYACVCRRVHAYAHRTCTHRPACTCTCVIARENTHTHTRAHVSTCRDTNVACPIVQTHYCECTQHRDTQSLRAEHNVAWLIVQTRYLRGCTRNPRSGE